MLFVRLHQLYWPVRLAHVNQLVTSAAHGADEVNAEVVNRRLNALEWDLKSTSHAFPHGDLPHFREILA